MAEWHGERRHIMLLSDWSRCLVKGPPDPTDQGEWFAQYDMVQWCFFLRYGANDRMWLSEAEGKALVAAAENKALTAALCCAGTSTLSHVASDHSLQTKAEPEPARDWHMQLPSAYEFVTRGSTSGLTAPIPRTSGPSPRAPHPSPADPAAPPSPTAEPLLPQTEEESHANQTPWGTLTYYPPTLQFMKENIEEKARKKTKEPTKQKGKGTADGD